MAENTTATPGTEGATPAAPPGTEAAVNPADAWLATASQEDIFKNDRIRGIFGSRLETEREKIRQQLTTEQDRQAREKAEANLLDLARSDPFTFAQTYLSKAEQERIQRETETLRSSTRNDFAQQLGRGYAALPEWSELTQAEQEKLGKSVIGKSDDEALVAFNAAAVDVIADRRAEKKHQAFRASDLDKERKAIREEEAAKRLKSSDRPAMVRGGKEPSTKGWQDLPAGADFNKEYEKNVLGRR